MQVDADGGIVGHPCPCLCPGLCPAVSVGCLSPHCKAVHGDVSSAVGEAGRVLGPAHFGGKGTV